MDASRIAGHVIISEPRSEASVPPLLYKKNGRLYLPDGRRAGADALLRRGAVMHDSKNNITLAGRVRFCELLCGASADFPEKIGVGDGGLESGTSAPLIPRDDDTELEHEVSRIAIAQRIVNTDDIPSLTFVGLFKTAGSYKFAQAGQTQISEVGLFCRDNTMTNNHNFAPIPVDVHRIGVMVEWEIVIL